MPERGREEEGGHLPVDGPETTLGKGHLTATGVLFEGDHLGHEPEWGVFSIHEMFRVIFIASIDRVLQSTLGACVETGSQDRDGARCELVRDLELSLIFLRTILSTGDLPFLSATNDRWAAAGRSRRQEPADRECSAGRGCPYDQEFSSLSAAQKVGVEIVAENVVRLVSSVGVIVHGDDFESQALQESDQPVGARVGPREEDEDPA
jgi:hypothetical protein